MRIAVMCATPGIGLCPYPVQLAVCFKEQGHEVHAICGSEREYETGLNAMLADRGVPTVRVPFSEQTGIRAFAPFDFSVRRALDDLKPDVVQSWGPRFAYQGRSFLFRKHRPLHVAMVMSMAHDRASKWPARVAAMLANRYLDCVLANCELELQRLSSIGVRREKTEIVFAPMGCPPNLALAAAARAEGRDAILRKFNLPIARKYLGYFAQFRPVKRHDLLVQAFIDLAGDFPEWNLVLAGDGECAEACKQLAQAVPGRIHFLGSIPHEQAIKLMTLMDAVAHCSTIETFGYAILEPLLLGIPTVTTRVGIAAEVERAKKAVVVEPGSRPALLEGLRAVMQADDRIRAMAAEGPRWITETFDTPRVAANLLALYNRLLGIGVRTDAPASTATLAR